MKRRFEESNQVDERDKATDESGMIDEYINALGEQDFKTLRVLMNDVVIDV